MYLIWQLLLCTAFQVRNMNQFKRKNAWHTKETSDRSLYIWNTSIPTTITAKTHQLWEAVRLLLWQYSHTMPWLAPLPSRSSVGVSPLGTGRGSRLRPQQMGYCPPLQVPPPLSFLAPCCKKTQGKVHEIEYWYKKLSQHKSSWYKSSLNINVKGFLHIYYILF